MRSALPLIAAGLLSLVASGQPHPDFSGTWTLAADSGKPAPAPGFGTTINIRQSATAITISKVIGGASVHVTHPLDGRETRVRTPGRLCHGDSETVWTAGLQEDALLTTYLGSITGTARTSAGIRTLFRLDAPDVMSVETTMPAAGAQQTRTVTARYRKTGPPADVPDPPTAVVNATIGQIEWLGGTWIGTSGPTTFEERWTPAADGSMLAVSRTLRGGAMTGFEFLCIVERSGGLVYQAMPNGRQPATDFPLTRMEPRSLTFENPAHDFPKRIRYTLGADGTLEAVISGSDDQKPQTFRFTRHQ